jgi:hypothetical protein
MPQTRLRNSESFAMKKSVLIALVTAFSFSAMAQNPTPPTTPNANAKAQNQLTNCPPDNPSNSQPVENSAIVPNATGSEQSAAPTVQRQGKAAEVSPNCKQENPQKK